MTQGTVTRFVRIRELECFEEVEERLLAGYPCIAVAAFVQDERGEALDVTRASLTTILTRYRASIPVADAVAAQLPRYFSEATRNFSDRLADLRALDTLLAALWYRFDCAHGRERLTGAIDPNVDRQARVMMDVIARMHEIRLDLGLVGQRQVDTPQMSPERIAEIRERYGDAAAQAFANPAARERVLAVVHAAQRLARRAEEREVTDVDSIQDMARPSARPEGMR
jgi:hypothetical protein